MPYSTLNLYKENANKEKFVIVYYRHGGNPIRHRTGVTVNSKNWDKKVGKVKPADESFETKNQIIKNSHDLVEQIVNQFILQNGIKPTCDFVKKEIQSGRKLLKEKIEANIIECFNDFLAQKRIEFASPERSAASLKDYVSTRNALIDYSQVVGTISPNSLNNVVWLNQFNRFLASPRKHIKGYKYMTGVQNDKTRDKRFSVLRTFSTWLIENNYLSSAKNLLSYDIKVQRKKYYALSLTEIKTLQIYKFENVTYQKAIDLFIVACHTGVRIGDVSRINRARIHKHNETEILIMNNQKTKEQIEVPLTEKANEIIKKYDYNLRLMTDQKVNFYLHEALQNFECFKEDYEYGVDGDTKPKYKLITFHTGRRTFITNLVNNNINLNAIMKMTGHRKISTLQQYINPDYELIIDNVKIFNDL
jgi:integrase